MDDQTHSIPDEQLLRIDDITKLTTLSKSCINLWVSQNRFPKPATLSATVRVWQMKDVRKWIANALQPSQEGV